MDFPLEKLAVSSLLLLPTLSGCAVETATEDPVDVFQPEAPTGTQTILLDRPRTEPRGGGGEAEKPPEEPVEEPDHVLSSAPHPPCADPIASPGGFAELLPTSDLEFRHRVDPTLLEDGAGSQLQLAGALAAGVVTADFDGDGLPDLFFPQTSGENELWWGEGGGRFAPAGASAGVGFADDLTAGASAADFDGDGDMDLVTYGLHSLRLLRNRGDGSFEDVTGPSGVQAQVGWNTVASWGDVDGDGDLDLFAGAHAISLNPHATADSALWINDGSSFRDGSASLPREAVRGAALLATFRDFDGDGDADLLLTHDFGDLSFNSMLLRNDGIGADGLPIWNDRLPSSGIGRLDAPMGASVEDLDGDGRLDLWFSDFDRTHLFRATDSFSFVDATLTRAGSLPWEETDVSWSVLAVDLDGSGRPGLFTAYGPLPRVLRPQGAWVAQQPDRWRAPQPGGAFPNYVDAPDVFPSPQTGDSRGVALSDLNRDGVPDLVVGHVAGPPSLLAGRCTASSRLVVELRDDRTANRFGIGAKVEIVAGGLRTVRHLDAGGLGTYSGSEPVAFFGLGNYTELDRLTVTWPGGEEAVFEDVCAHCRVRVRRTP